MAWFLIMIAPFLITLAGR
ncbi:cytochrome bd oxidase small subunit CydS [Escherichia coli]